MFEILQSDVDMCVGNRYNKFKDSGYNVRIFRSTRQGWIITLVALTHLTVLGYVQGGLYNGPGYNAIQEDWQKTTESNDVENQAYFDAMAPRNVTALVGKTAYLTCRVHNLGNKTVSWIRHRDLHILTVGTYSYTSDERFQTTHHKDKYEWMLHIKWAQQRDAGMYECQIPTQPVKSYFVYLNVVGRDWPRRQTYFSPLRESMSNGRDQEMYQKMYSDQDSKLFPIAVILGGPDLHVDKGSTINITCAIRFSPEPPAHIFWFHQDQAVSNDPDRGGVSILTEKGDITTSRLLIKNADTMDSGKYSCHPSNAEVASVRVHVLNGEMPAAMQTGSAGQSSSARHIVEVLLLLSLHNYVLQNILLRR